MIPREFHREIQRSQIGERPVQIDLGFPWGFEKRNLRSATDEGYEPVSVSLRARPHWLFQYARMANGSKWDTKAAVET